MPGQMIALFRSDRSIPERPGNLVQPEFGTGGTRLSDRWPPAKPPELKVRMAFSPHKVREFRRLSNAIVLMLVIAALAGCSSTGSQEANDPELSPTAAGSELSAAGTPGTERRAPCHDGRLLVADLPLIDNQWEPGLEESRARAAEWQEDSRLVEFRVSCGLFEPGFRWQATYFSEEAQALYAADTRESNPLDVDPEAIPTLDLSEVSFAALREALLSVDYTDDNELEPSTGVDIRVNSTGLPFGPPEAPIGSTIAHVSIEFRGEVKDLFISSETGDIFQFSSPSG
jgi:hypothetical protein